MQADTLAVTGVIRSIKTMADGTPRITIDLECPLAEIAQMGVEPGTAYALARLTPKAASPLSQPAPEEPADKPGPLCQWAVMRCKEPEFFEFMKWRFPDMEPADYANEEEFCKDAILQFCSIESRKELDSYVWAADLFKDHIMKSWRDWQKNNQKTS